MNHHEKHEKIEELIAAGAVGGLDASDLAELDRLRAAHGPDCPECRRLEDEYGEVSGRLAFSPGPGEVPAGMEDRVVAAAFSRGRGAAVLFVAGGGVGGYLLAPRSSPSVAEDALRFIAQPGTHGVFLRPFTRGTATLEYRLGAAVSYLTASHLGPAPAGHVYELWLFRGKTPISAGTFAQGDTILQVRADASTAAMAAITIERAPGASRPTTSPILSAPITS